MNRFVKANRRLSLACFNALAFSPFSLDARNACRKHPFAWMLLLIPIAGPAFFYGLKVEAEHERRWKRLEERKSKIGKIRIG